MSKKQGFTLLELIIVIIVIGILASVALPRYQVIVERSRAAEAKHILGVIRSAQMRYYSQYYNYANTLNRLDIEIPTSQFFDYGILAGQPSHIGMATRKDYLRPLGFTLSYLISIDENGTISMNPNYSPYNKLL